MAGALFGVLLLGSSLLWALYKFKPGLLSAAAGGSSSETAPFISPPRASSNFSAVQAAGGYSYAPVKVEINGGTGLGGGGSAEAYVQTLQTMNSLDLAQFGDSGASTGVFVHFAGGNASSRATQTMLTSSASLFDASSWGGGGARSWGSSAAATSTMSRDASHFQGHVFETSHVVSVARPARATAEISTMTVANSGTQTDASLDQTDMSYANTMQVNRSATYQQSASPDYNTMQTQTLSRSTPLQNDMTSSRYVSSLISETPPRNVDGYLCPF